VALDLVADYTLADVALNIDRLDMQFLRRSLSKHSSRLSLLPHPVQLEDIGLIREDHLQRVVNLLKASYSHLVLDLSKSYSPLDQAALRMADAILLVAQLELSSIRNVVRILLSLANDPALAGKTQVVLNRFGNESDITDKKAEETIGKQIFWKIPDDARSMTEARNQGVPLLTCAPRSKLHQEIRAMTLALAGKQDSGQSGKGKKKSWWG